MNYLQYKKIDYFVSSVLAPGHPETPNGTAASIQYRIGAPYILWRVLKLHLSRWCHRCTELSILRHLDLASISVLSAHLSGNCYHLAGTCYY